jgi:hypothetical protein
MRFASHRFCPHDCPCDAYALLTAGLLAPIASDAHLAEEKRHPLDRLYQRVVTDLDALLRAVGLRTAARTRRTRPSG